MDHEFDILDDDGKVHHKMIKEEEYVLAKKESLPANDDDLLPGAKVNMLAEEKAAFRGEARELPDGTFAKPSGGVPKGYIWNSTVGLWAPLSRTSQPNAKHTKPSPTRMDIEKESPNHGNNTKNVSHLATKQKQMNEAALARDSVGQAMSMRLSGCEYIHDGKIRKKGMTEGKEHVLKLAKYNDAMLAIVPLKNCKDSRDIDHCKKV